MKELTLDDVLKKAIQKEIESQRLYTDLGWRVREGAVRNAFHKLVQQEKGHQDMLESYRRGELKEGALSPQQVLDYRIAEHFYQPEITQDMKLPDVFLLAANREKASHELYLNLAKVHPAGQMKKLLKGLAAQELEHKDKVEFLYTEVVFPQTDGG